MTAALIFRRQLVRHKVDLFTASSTTDKLPLEKFHRLLDLVFWGKFLKFESISLFVFFGEFYRVSLNPVILCGPAALLKRGRGGVPRLAAPPGPRLPIAKFWQ
jgi:hypothetical protein